MTNQGWFKAVVLCAPIIVGCTSSDHVEDGFDFRESNDPWLLDPSIPGNGDIEVREGGDDDDIDVPDTIIWDLDGGDIYRQVDTGLMVKRMSVVDDELWLAGQSSPTVSCTAVVHATPDVFQLVQPNGAPAVTVWQGFVFVGDLPTANDMAALTEQAAFKLSGDRILAGSTGEVVATASASLDRAGPMRRLVLGALVTGECGSGGLP